MAARKRAAKREIRSTFAKMSLPVFRLIFHSKKHFGKGQRWHADFAL
jgi:hypothetical protein